MLKGPIYSYEDQSDVTGPLVICMLDTEGIYNYVNPGSPYGVVQSSVMASHIDHSATDNGNLTLRVHCTQEVLVTMSIDQLLL